MFEKLSNKGVRCVRKKRRRKETGKKDMSCKIQERGWNYSDTRE